MTTIDVYEVHRQVEQLRLGMRRALDALGDRFEAQVELILKIASGDVVPEPDERDHLLKMIDGALASLRVPLVGTMGDVLPSGFWLTELGLAIMRARLILADDELITRAEAAGPGRTHQSRARSSAKKESSRAAR